MKKGLLILSTLLVFAAFMVAGCNKAARTTTTPSTTAPTSPSTK